MEHRSIRLLETSANLRSRPVLAFDIMGTLFDWHSGLTRDFQDIAVGDPVLEMVDWAELVRAYRQNSLTEIKGAVNPEGNFDAVLERTLSRTLSDYDVTLTNGQYSRALMAWRTLPAFDDVQVGLRRLSQKFKIVPFTVVSESTTRALTDTHQIVWDEIVSCDLFGIYKTHPNAYARAAQHLHTPPANITLVACHDFDLAAAAEAGFQTAFISRPNEWGTLQSPASGAGTTDHFDSLTTFASAHGC